MTPATVQYLDRLRSDDAARASLVELLRASAARLRDTELEDQLTRVASLLCDHCRIRDHECLLCGAMVVTEDR